MPQNMPHDNYFRQFEHNSISAQLLFCARSYTCEFADFRNINAEEMDNNPLF